MSSIQKITNHVESPLTRARKLSPTFTHAYNSYPLVEELVQVVLSIQIVNYIATVISQGVLKLKEEVLDKYVSFVFSIYTTLDEYVLKTFVIGLFDKYVPIAKQVHLKDLSPFALYKTFKSYVVSFYKDVESKTKPAVVSTVNPILSPVNNSIEKAIDAYLPKPTEAVATTTSSDEIDKLFKLTSTAIGRTIPIVEAKYQAVKKYPVELQSHVSKIYNSELDKSEKSIPRAVVGTSTELATEISQNLGLTQKAKEVGNGASEAVASASEAVENLPANGSISVGA
jgi:hypothetical protein